MNVHACLSFEGRCEEAIGFYQGAVGAEVASLFRFKKTPTEACPPGGFPAAMLEKVMHAELRIGEAMVYMSDGRCTGQADFHGVTLAIDAKSDAEAEKIFDALTEGGKVMMPMEKTFFASKFGMGTDRFGVPWMVLRRG